MVRQIAVELTKKGLPALWEEGGGATNTGEAIIVAGPQGEPLIPIYVKTGGPLSCGRHALFVIKPGYHVVSVSRWRDDYEIYVYRIVSIDTENKTANVEKICEFSLGEWDQDPPEYLLDAIEAAKKKSRCYHCREPHFMADP